MFAIIGAGFGIYGYLPALIDGCEQLIVLPKRYRTRLAERPELARFSDYIRWESDEEAALSCAEGVVLALPPIIQSEWIPRCVACSNIDRLLLEKPLAHTPDVAAAIFDELIRSKKVFRIGYTFRYTELGQLLFRSFSMSQSGGSVAIHWSFLAHHYRYSLRNWKRSNAAGGGAVRFYGIHLVALLAELGYREVNFSRTFGAHEDDVEKWNAGFSGAGLPECEVCINTKATVSSFFAKRTVNDGSGQATSILADLGDPFESKARHHSLDGIDPRVHMLQRICHSLWQDGNSEYEWYDATIKLWRKIEERTLFELVA